MEEDLAFAKDNHIPILPILMEEATVELYNLYSQPEKFGDLQYLEYYQKDKTAIAYEEKLKKNLEATLTDEQTVKRVRAAFDAYIFLSYRKKDRRYANELMRLIHKNPECRDVAIWYDEFLTPGESFRANIKKMMQDSKLFTLLVTPNLLEYVDGEPNYVMAHEYPDAKKAGMDILPTEMEETDKTELRSKYEDIPECVNPNEDELFKKRLLDSLSKIAIYGLPETVDELDKLKLSAIDFREIEAGKLTFTVRLELPDGIYTKSQIGDVTVSFNGGH
jgi:hypothetical protein